MNKYPLWRYILLVLLIVLGVIYALPNMYGSSPAIQISAKGDATLQGVEAKVVQVLQQDHIKHGMINQEGDQLLVRFADPTVQFQAQDVVQQSLGSNYIVAANLVANTPAWLRDLGAEPMRLGLDLQGGVHFLLAVDVKAMVHQREMGDLHSMVDQLRANDLHYSSVNLDKARHGIQLTFPTLGLAKKAADVLSDNFFQYQIKTGSVNGVAVLTAKLLPASLVKIENYAVDQNISTLRNRVNALGVAEPVIQRQGATHISVDLPGIQDMARAQNLIGKVATIELHLQDSDHDANAAANGGVIPFGSQLYYFHGQPVLLKNQIVLRGSSIVSAATSTGQNGMPAVAIRLNGDGAELFNRITGDNIGKPLAVVYVQTKSVKTKVGGKVVLKHVQQRKVINIATIQSALGNSFQITGLDSVKEANNLALLLRSGAYSAPVDFVAHRLIGPSLGRDNIHMGILSTEIGSLAVIIFMLLYYRLFGIFADMALLLNIIFIMAIGSLLGVTLTLPGIAGIVLTVGMAVDANVLINERIREELRLGMSPQASIFAGYERAFVTIVDSNVTTLIVAVVLLALGSGSVQGFAVMLIIGILTSMVTSIFFTRALVNLIYGTRKQLSKLSIGIRVK